MKNTKKIVNGVMAFISMLLLIFLDQAVKLYIDSNYKVGETTPVIKNVFHITYVVNEGAAWSSFSGKTVMLLSVTAVILVAVIMAYVVFLKKDMFKPLRVLMVFLASGAIGNMIDRFTKGYVVDMFDFKLIHFPVFNVADIYVTCSVIIGMILILFKYNDDDFAALRKNGDIDKDDNADKKSKVNDNTDK